MFIFADGPIAAITCFAVRFCAEFIGATDGAIFDAASCGASVTIFVISVVAFFAEGADTIAAGGSNAGFADVRASVTLFDDTFGGATVVIFGISVVTLFVSIGIEFAVAVLDFSTLFIFRVASCATFGAAIAFVSGCSFTIFASGFGSLAFFVEAGVDDIISAFGDVDGWEFGVVFAALCLFDALTRGGQA